MRHRAGLQRRPFPDRFPTGSLPSRPWLQCCCHAGQQAAAPGYNRASLYAQSSCLLVLPFLPFFFFFLVGGGGIGGGGFIFGANASRQEPSAGEAASGVCGAALEHSPASPPAQGSGDGEGEGEGQV